MGGGLIKIGGTRLYDLILIDLVGAPFFIFKYDQLIHTYCYFVIFILVYFVISKYFPKKNHFALLVVSVLVAAGVGVLNEVIELAMVVFAGAAEAVGDYYNNALDLVFNLIGSVIAAVLMHYRHKNEKRK